MPPVLSMAMQQHCDRTKQKSSELIFPTRAGKPLDPQRSEVRQILIDDWMGHSNASMGDRYGRQLVEDVAYRQDHVKKVGLGFEPPPALFGLRGLQKRPRWSSAPTV